MKKFVKGIEVIKYDYTQMSNREIILKLSPDYSVLKWEHVCKTNFSFLVKKREIEISKI